jgi:hypothetical protein
VLYKLKTAPKGIPFFAITAAALAVFFGANLVYQVLRKPTEVFFPVSSALNKTPLET